MKWNSNFRLNYSVTDKGPFEIFRCFQNFSAGTSQKFVFHIYFPTGISRNFLQCMEPRRPFQTVCTERFVTTQTTPQEYCDETRAITVKEVRIKEITIDHRYKLAFHDKYVYACNCIKGYVFTPLHKRYLAVYQLIQAGDRLLNYRFTRSFASLMGGRNSQQVFSFPQ